MQPVLSHLGGSVASRFVICIGIKMRRIVNRVEYIILLFLTLVLFVFLHHYFIFLCLVLLLVLPILSLRIAHYTIPRIKVSIEEKFVPYGKQVEIPLVLHMDNPTIFPVLNYNIYIKMWNCFYEKEEQVVINVPVRAKQQQIIKVPLTFLYSGIVKVSLYEIRATDWLQMKSFRKKEEKQIEFLILPMEESLFEEMKKIGGIGLEESLESQGKGESSAEMKSIREYQVGDKLQKIHWKLSAKKQEFMVKEYDAMSAKELTILFELFQSEDYILDTILDVVYSFAKELLEQKESFCMCWWSERQGELKTEYLENLEDLPLVFQKVFLEKTYQEKNKAYFMEREKGMGSGIRFYVQTLPKGEATVGEDIFYYQDKIVITELGREI